MELRFRQKKDCALWGFLGIILAILGLGIYSMDPLSLIVKDMMTLKEGSMAHKLWETVPVEIYLNAYIFNITNADRFSSGKDKKIVLQEIGPYVFKETRANKNITYNENKTMTYIPSLSSELILEKSIGDPRVDRIIIPNIPLLGLLSIVSDAPGWKKFSVKSLLWGLGSKPLLNMTVDEFMWGYEDPMVRLLAGFLPNWIDFEKFGILDRVYADKTSAVTINLNETSEEYYSIQFWNGSPGLKQWGFNEINDSNALPCNTLKGTFEGLIFPSGLKENTSLRLYKKSFCRPLNAFYSKTVDLDMGLRGYRYEISEDELKCSNPDNVCYCPKNKCLPDGLSDLTPCYYGLNIAMSFPHFLHANESLLDRIVGLKPDPEKHTSFVIIQPDIGMPIQLSTKTQINMVINNIDFMSGMKPFSNMVIPILWMDGYVDGLPDNLQLKMVMAFKYLPVAQQVIAWGFLAIGLSIFIYKTILYLLLSSKDDKRAAQHALKYIQVAMSDTTMRQDFIYKH